MAPVKGSAESLPEPVYLIAAFIFNIINKEG